MAIGLVIVGMEELNWGQRILGFSTPQLLEPVNFQGAMSFHNTRAFRDLLQYGRIAILVWSAVSVLLPILWPRLHRGLERYGVPFASLRTLPIFLMAVVVDKTQPVIKAQELAELLLGLGFAFLAVELFAQNHGSRRPSPAMTVRNSVLLILVLVILSTSLVATRGGDLKSWLHMAATESYPQREMYDQAELIFDYIDRHPELRRPDTALRRGEVLQQAGRQADAEIILRHALASESSRRTRSTRVLQEAGRSLEAEAILRQALARESSRRRRSEGMGALYRRTAQIRLMLGAKEEVAADLEEALRLDRQALAVATTGDDKARLLWSIAQTQLVRGEKDGARRTAQQAVDTAGTVAIRHRIRKWLLEDLPNL